VDFKAILGINGREDTLSRYCFITAAILSSNTANGGFYGEKTPIT
jgi:hypothetical protein